MSHVRDLKCPNCGSDDDFEIDTVATIRVSKHDFTVKSVYDGWDGWAHDSYMGHYVRCMKCDHDGTVKDFTVDTFPTEPPPSTA